MAESSFHLPNLGRTVSHSMTPAHMRKNTMNEVEDPKLMEMLSKGTFGKMDD
jgi:hypothetical protein